MGRKGFGLRSMARSAKTGEKFRIFFGKKCSMNRPHGQLSAGFGVAQ